MFDLKVSDFAVKIFPKILKSCIQKKGPELEEISLSDMMWFGWYSSLSIKQHVSFNFILGFVLRVGPFARVSVRFFLLLCHECR